MGWLASCGLALLLAPGAAAGAQWYVDSVHGSDGRSGDSPSAAVQSLGKLLSLDLQPGDQVRLIRGGVWREPIALKGGSAAGGPIQYSSYGDPSQPKPRLLGSLAVTSAGNWSAVPNATGLWRTLPRSLVPAPDAHQLLLNGDFQHGQAGWGLWNENPEGDSHVSGGVEQIAVPSQPPRQHAFHVQMRDMDVVPQSYTQLYTTNISVVSGQDYTLSFWAKASVALNISQIPLFSMAPPYHEYAAAVGPLSISAAGWRRYAVNLRATATASDGRITWLLDNRGLGLPNNAELWLGACELIHVVPENPTAASFDSDVQLFFGVGSRVGSTGGDGTTAGYKRWTIEDVKATGDFYLDVATKQLTTYCASGPPATCWKGEIEAAVDTTIVTLASHVIVEDFSIMYGAAHGVNGGGSSIVIRNCDIAWIGGGVLSYHWPGRSQPVRFGNGIQTWNGATDVEVYGNRIWQIYDTPVTNQGQHCTSGAAVLSGSAPSSSCAMRNISWHHNLLANSGMACVEIWYSDPGATMDDIRFENNLCANIGDGGWSAAQRPDPAGRSVCSYDNTAKTSGVSVVNNIFWETQGFEAMLYMSNTWSTWAAGALTFSNNALYRTAELPPSPPEHLGWGAQHSFLVRLVGDKEAYGATNFSSFMAQHGGQGAHSVLTDPMLSGVSSSQRSLSIEEVTAATPSLGSPLLGAGELVRWKRDFAGRPLPAAPQRPDIGPFQRGDTDEWNAQPWDQL